MKSSKIRLYYCFSVSTITEEAVEALGRTDSCEEAQVESVHDICWLEMIWEFEYEKEDEVARN